MIRPDAPPPYGALRRQTIAPQQGGGLRNYGEASRDGGETWQREFDFHHTRR